MRYDSTNFFATVEAQGRRDDWLAAQIGVSRSLISRLRSKERFADEGFAEKASRVLQAPKSLLFLPLESQSCDDSAQDGDKPLLSVENARADVERVAD